MDWGVVLTSVLIGAVGANVLWLACLGFYCMAEHHPPEPE